MELIIYWVLRCWAFTPGFSYDNTELQAEESMMRKIQSWIKNFNPGLAWNVFRNWTRSRLSWRQLCPAVKALNLQSRLRYWLQSWTLIGGFFTGVQSSALRPRLVNSQVTSLSLARAISSLVSGLLGFLYKLVFKLKLGHLYGLR